MSTEPAPFLSTTGGKLAGAASVWLLLGGAVVSFMGGGATGAFHLLMTVIIFTGMCGYIGACLFAAKDYPVEIMGIIFVVPFVASLAFPASYLLAEGSAIAGVGFLIAAAAAGAISVKGKATA